MYARMYSTSANTPATDGLPPSPVLAAVSGEPEGTHPENVTCPLRLLNGTVLDVSDATPPSPPGAPPPPSPPLPPSPPPLPPNVGCLFISCEVLSDEEVARLEAAALLEHAVSAASAARRAGSALGTLLLAGVSASALSRRSTQR
jgi:hypothetical protein